MGGAARPVHHVVRALGDRGPPRNGHSRRRPEPAAELGRGLAHPGAGGGAGQRAKPPQVVAQVGIDEKAIAKGHQYLTLVCDLARATVEYIAEDRNQASLDGYFAGLSASQLTAIAMDMWEPYLQAIRTHVPDAGSKIVFDRYHIMTHMGKAVDTVRKREHRTLRASGDETLTGSKYLWLYAEENLPATHRPRLKGLLARPLTTARLGDQGEPAGPLELHPSGLGLPPLEAVVLRGPPIRAFPRDRGRPSDPAPPTQCAAYFAHPITNAVSEGLNSKIQTIKKMAYGFRNRDHFKTALYFHCGGLDLYPATRGIPG